MGSRERTDERGDEASRRQFCDRIDAECLERFRRGHKVQLRYKNWRITLDTNTVPTGESSVTVTRMRVPFVSRDGLRFKLSRKNLFDTLAGMCGVRTIEVGHPEFDRDFVIRGNDELKVRDMFADPTVRRLLCALPSVNLEVRDNEGLLGVHFPEEVDELCFRAAGFINDVEQLKLLFALFAEVLNRLCRMGSACEDSPELLL